MIQQSTQKPDRTVDTGFKVEDRIMIVSIGEDLSFYTPGSRKVSTGNGVRKFIRRSFSTHLQR